MLTGLKDGSIVGAQRVVSQLLAMLVQKRVPSCLTQPLELTKREQLSLEALNSLFFHLGYFDETPPLETPQTWVIGWLFSRETVSDSDIDRALQYTQNDDELSAIVALIALVRQRDDGLLTPIQTQHLLRRSPLLGQIKIMKTLWSIGKFEQLQDTLNEMEKKSCSSIPPAFIQFRRAEVLECQGQLEAALGIYERLLEHSAQDWFLWSSITRLRLKKGESFSIEWMRVMPVFSVDDDSRVALMLWRELEEAFERSEKWSGSFSQRYEVFESLGVKFEEFTSPKK